MIQTSMSKSVYSKDYKEIIERLKKARIEADLSQQVVADKLGKPQSYISKIESGERRLDVVEMKKFAVVYKKPVDYFLKWKQNTALNATEIRRPMEIFVTPVSRKQKYVVDANNEKVFLNLKRIRKVLLVKYQGEVNVGIVVVGKNLCPKKIEKDLKKYTHRHP